MGHWTRVAGAPAESERGSFRIYTSKNISTEAQKWIEKGQAYQRDRSTSAAVTPAVGAGSSHRSPLGGNDS